jgi:hypothetical protein
MRLHPFRLITLISQDDLAPWLPFPLRYAGGSQLLRASPPARPATVLCSSRICRLEFSLSPPVKLAAVPERAFTCSIREPGPGSCCLYAGHHLGSKRITPRLIPGPAWRPGSDVISLDFDASDGRGLCAHRSSSRPAPDAIKSRLFPRRSRRRSSANAPRGGLKSPSARRLRRSRCSSISSYSTAVTEPANSHGPAFHAHVHNRQSSFRHISRGSRSAPPHTPGHGRCFPGMLLSPSPFGSR